MNVATDARAPSPDVLFASLYHELVRLAQREVSRNGAMGLLSARTVVHEAWIGLSGRASLAFEQRAQFLGYAARMMRGVVIDHLRRSGSQKRGGGVALVSIDDGDDAVQVPAPAAAGNVEAVAAALDQLARLAPELAQVVDLRFFCGFSIAEIARMQRVSLRTAQRRWEKARLLLYASFRD